MDIQKIIISSLKRLLKKGKDSLRPFILFFKKPFLIKVIPLENILLGSECDLEPIDYAFMSNDFGRFSKRVKDGPQFKFLMDFVEYGERVFDENFFVSTDYYKNAAKIIKIFGEYYPGIRTTSEIIAVAKRFTKLYLNEGVGEYSSDGHNQDGELIEVYPIKGTGYYQLKQGNHRCAFALMNGEKRIKAKVFFLQGQITPIQFLMPKLLWEEGSCYLYQPLPCAELTDGWILARKCEDRFYKMINFLRSFPDSDSYRVLDLGSYFGWFVSEFKKKGFYSIGVERDNVAISIGKIAYENLDNSIIQDDIMDFLSENSESNKFEVVLCLSIVHHYLYGKNKGDPLLFLKRLSDMTQRVLFLDMGQSNEIWFAGLLKEWNPKTIKNWILQHTEFKTAYELGSDQDGQGQFEGNYGRMLFAFVK